MPTTVNQNPEQKARDVIDAQLEAAGWAVQSKNEIDLSASRGVAVREFDTDTGFKWLKDDTITPDDYTLAEVMGELAATGKTYAAALEELNALVEGIAE